MEFSLPENMTIDRVSTYKGQDYRVIEILRSDMLLVVKKEDFDTGVFPIQTYVIPGQ